MKRFITIILGAMLLLLSQSAFAQVRKSGNASVTNDRGAKVGAQYVSINLSQNGPSTVTLGSMKMSARIYTTKKDTKNGIIAYGVTLTASNGKTVGCVINTYLGKSHITMVVHYADGKLVYEL